MDVGHIAFAGAQGALNRAAALRKDGAYIDDLFAKGRILPFWRGKVAYDASQNTVVWLRADHPALSNTGTQIFLGLQAEQAYFAVDLSNWQPESDITLEAGFLDQTSQPHPMLTSDTGFVDLRAVMTTLSPLDAECAATAKALLSWHDSHGFCARCGARSAVVDAGWQRQCLICHSPHFPRTDPVVIMLVTQGDSLLLGRSANWPEGMYSLLAGFVEPGEVMEAAVRREVFEETGVHVGKVRYLASQPWPFPANLMLGCHAMATSSAITLDPAELQDALWLTRQEVLDVQLGRHPHVKAGRKGAIAQALIMAWLADKI